MIPRTGRFSWRRDRLPTLVFLGFPDGNQNPLAQTVKNPLAMWETWVRSLSWEVPLEKEMATHSIFLA